MNINVQNDAESGRLGNPHTMTLIRELKPRYWFSAHLHCKFPAIVEHGDNLQTHFLALDKPLPHRNYLQILDIDVESEESVADEALYFDPEWLAILKFTDHLVNTKKTVNNFINNLV